MNWLVFITGVFCYMIIKSGDSWATEAVWEICDSQFLSKGWLYLILFLEIRLDNCYSTDGEETLKGCFSHCSWGIFFSVRFNFNYSVFLWLLLFLSWVITLSWLLPQYWLSRLNKLENFCFHTSESKWTTNRQAYLL